jgi:hypothetical protein
MAKRKLSRTQKLLNHLLRGNTVNGRQALTRFGIYRLSAAIFNFRKKGIEIETVMTERAGNKYATYKVTGVPHV